MHILARFCALVRISVYRWSTCLSSFNQFYATVLALEDFEVTRFFTFFSISHTILLKIFGKVLSMPAPTRPPSQCWVCGWQGHTPTYPSNIDMGEGGGGFGVYKPVSFNSVAHAWTEWQGRKLANIFWAWLSSKRNLGTFTKWSVSPIPLGAASWKNYDSFITCLYIYPPVFSSVMHK